MENTALYLAQIFYVSFLKVQWTLRHVIISKIAQVLHVLFLVPTLYLIIGSLF